jgi:hypothetical protein
LVWVDEGSYFRFGFRGMAFTTETYHIRTFVSETKVVDVSISDSVTLPSAWQILFAFACKDHGNIATVLKDA